MRQYVLVGSLLLAGCVALPETGTPVEPAQEAVADTNLVVENDQPEVTQVEEQSTIVNNVASQSNGEVSTVTTVSVSTQVDERKDSSSAAVVNEPNQQSLALVATNVAATVKPVLQPRADMPPTNAVGHWLALAEKAYAKDYLTTPASNNAYAYYGRVLLQEPDNRQALAGLEKIVQRYLKLALSSQRKGKASQAKLFLQRANKVIPRHRDIAVVEAELVRMAAANKGQAKAGSKKSVTQQAKTRQVAKKFAALQTQQQSIMEAPAGMQRQRILLPPSALQVEAPALAIYLRSLARQIEAVDGRLFIIAPKDKQVRWVYSLLNGTNPDYRIRANMKHKKPAAIEVMYSGDEPLLDVFK